MFALAPVMIARAPLRIDDAAGAEDFYFTPSWFAIFGVGIAGLAGIVCPAHGSGRADRVAYRRPEILLMFGAMGLDRPVWAEGWGVAWQWDAKLTIALRSELIFVAYLQSGSEAPDQKSWPLRWRSRVVAPFVYAEHLAHRSPSTSVVPTLGPGCSAFCGADGVPALLHRSHGVASAGRASARGSRRGCIVPRV